MEQMVIYRDRQEILAEDLNNSQIFAQNAIDRLVKEAITSQLKFSGMVVTATDATTISIGIGAYYNDGKVYVLQSAVDYNFLGQLPAVSQRYAAVTLSTSLTDTDIQERDYLTDVENDVVTPSAVAMRRDRTLSINISFGTESAAPAKPPVAADTIAVAYVLLDNTGIASIERVTANEIVSLGALDARVVVQEGLSLEAQERFETIAGDIANLKQSQSRLADKDAIEGLIIDVARLRTLSDLEDGWTGYGADPFLSDDVPGALGDDAFIGYAAKVEEGLRFPDVAANQYVIGTANPEESRVIVSSSGLMLPEYWEKVRLRSSSFKSGDAISITDAGFQTVTWKLMAKSATRLRAGPARTVCINNRKWREAIYAAGYDGVFNIDGRTYQTLTISADSIAGRREGEGGSREKFIRIQEVWSETEKDFYQKRVVTDYAVGGAVIAQTFLMPTNGWLTRIAFRFPKKGPTGDVHIHITDTINGVPDPDAVLGTGTIAHADIIEGDAFDGSTNTPVVLDPIALEAGKMFGIVVQTAGNHQIAMAYDGTEPIVTAGGSQFQADEDNEFLQPFNGVFFTSTDGEFFQGDLTKDIWLKLFCAQFGSTRVAVDLTALSLSGGIADLDITAEQVAPAGTSVTYKVKPDGTSRWLDVDNPAQAPFDTLHVLCGFRTIFTGAKDFMPGIVVTNSKVRISRPDTAMLWVSEAITIPSTQDVSVTVVLDRFREANHDCTVTLDDETNAATNIAAASSSDEVLETDGAYQRIRRTFTWTNAELTSATTSIRIKVDGSAVSGIEVFHGEEVVYLTF